MEHLYPYKTSLWLIGVWSHCTRDFLLERHLFNLSFCQKNKKNNNCKKNVFRRKSKLCVCVYVVFFASPGMVLSVLVVLLLTVFYELLKVWRVWLGSHSKLAQPQSRYATQASYSGDRTSVLEDGPSESSLFPLDPQPPAVSIKKRSVNTTVALHVVHYNINSQIDVMADLFFWNWS